MSASDSDLLVIGGGVLGAFHAYAAVERGLRVVLLERDAEPRGATVRNFGQVVPSGLNQRWQPVGRESLLIYKQLQEECDLSVRQLGSIYIASDDEECCLLEELREINVAADYPCQLWTADQCQDRYPNLRRNYCRGGLFFPEEISVNPRQMVHRMHRYLAEQPRFRGHFRSCVSELVSESGDRVRATTTCGRQFTAAKAVLCGGHEFQLLYPEMFRASRLEAVKLQMLRLSPQPEISMPGNVLTGRSIRRYESFAECPSWPSIKPRESDQDFAKQWGVHILFKQEVDGGIILGDSHEYAKASDIDVLDFKCREDIQAFLVNEARRIFELPRWDIESAWYGIYCQTADKAGIFTETVDQRIHIVTGIGGKGMTSSPGFAKRHLAEIFHK